MSDVLFMELALKEAEDAYKKGEVPVGAVIVDSRTKDIIATAGNYVEEGQDPTAHAEMIAIRKACRHFQSPRLIQCDLYVTLEPCPMCAQAISFARIRRLYFGAYDMKGGGVENGPCIFHQKTCHHLPEIYGGICEKEAMHLLKDFFKKKRQ